MKRLIIILILALASTAAVAACITNTYFINGRVMICTTCCTPGYGCTTTCTGG